jgi:hypothetical protein
MNLDWIAGFFDGEGSASVRIAHNATCKYGFQIAPEITISQKRRAVIKAIHRRLGFGHVYPTGRSGWQFALHSRADIERFSALMQKRSVLKRRQLGLLTRTLRLLERQGTPSARFRGGCLSKDTMRELLLIAKQMRTLNYTKHARTVDLSQLEAKLYAPT